MTGEDPPVDERDRLADIDRFLARERPIPRPAFRSQLRRRLVSDSSGAPRGRVRLLIATYAGAGALLLAIAAVGVAGTGPLAP
jgi:hypothetical protein